MRQRKIIRHLTNAAIFFILEMAALTILRNNGPLQDTWFGTTGQAVSSFLWGWTEDLDNYFSLDERNDSLAAENYRLHVRLAKLEQMIADSTKLSEEFLNSISDKFRYTPAQISKISNNSLHNYIIIDKGSKDGVVKGSGIITEKGVIGVIDAVSESFSYARSFRNHNTTISTRVRRTGPAGSMIWDGKSTNKAILMEIPLHVTITPGDTVYTSGFSSVFPPDIPLGTIGDSRVVNGASHEIDVTLFEDFLSLRHVIVTENINRSEISILEEER